MADLVTADQLAAALGMVVPSSDPDVERTCQVVNEWLPQYLRSVDDTGAPIDHSQHPYCCQAALVIAVDTWTSARSAGGQPVDIDYQPAPYTMGATLLRRVAGLIAPCRSVTGMVG